MTEYIELTLQVATPDEASAARVWEVLSRTALGLRLTEDVTIELRPDRYTVACNHDHDEVGP